MKQIQSSEELMLRSLAPARKVKKVELWYVVPRFVLLMSSRLRCMNPLDLRLNLFSRN
jgi:hypothetical protein